MTLPPLDRTRGRQRRARHNITAVGKHTRSDDVEHGMTSPPLGSTHGQATSGVACNHRLWTAHTVERRRGWHAIIALGQHTQSNDVGRGMSSSPLGSTNGRMTSCMACHNRLWTSSHNRTASGVACHHHPLTENAVEQCWAWHAIIAFGKHTRSNDVGRGITSPPLDSKHGRTTSAVACHHRLWAAHTVERCRA